ncbi:MAG: HAMP domain-containing histidine kinase [Gammaproteobacteria bacterium]|nr:HAMP domain-containing histidine kinase [Gammaproteobacteria bacterium]
MLNYLRSKWQSLVFRLLFYFLISILALAIVLAISFVQRLRPHVQNQILPNVERYVEYLLNDIGDPPDLAVAQRLADELPFEIRIEGQGVNWSSTPALRPISSYHFEAASLPYEHVYFSHHRRQELVMIQRHEMRYLFVVDDGFRRGSERRHWLLFVFIGALLIVLYLLIRRLLRPLGAISEQVRSIGEGDLEQAADIDASGELGTLAVGIKHMSQQIKSMLEGKSGMLLAISHELRSPLTRMRVNLELLGESDIRRKLIEDCCEMENLLAAILESEKLGGHAPLSLSSCQLAKLIEEVVANHPCRERINSRLLAVELDVDELRLKLLLKNLLDNACHYSGDDQGEIEVTLRIDDSAVLLEVSDRGVGIAADDLARLTEAFYRPDSARQRDTGGYGLGLYLCRLITEAHGGELGIDSEPGKGTRVIVKLPLDNS